MITIHFQGAAGTVTGSKYLVDVKDTRFMVDCGLFQGPKELRLRNWEQFPVDPATVEQLILTHAHIDHTGYLPRLSRDGFRGPVHCTHGTADLTALLLRDSAHLQEEEANYLNRKRLSKHDPALPLYTILDAERSLENFQKHRYNTPFGVMENGWGVFRDAGHILGSAWLELNIQGAKVVFSGDLGRTDAPILRDPAPPEEADYLILESTYGNRLHGDHDINAGLIDVIQRTVQKKGVLVIPAFAVERSQEILYLLHDLIRTSRLPQLPVFLDSPMAVRATRLFRQHQEYYDDDARKLQKLGEKVLGYPRLSLCESVDESKAIAKFKPPFIVISASGMATGGRILHHLKRYLPHRQNTILLVGYQAVGTRGWRLLNKEQEIKIHGEMVPVRAEVEKLDGFSGHADYSQIDVWLSRLKQPPKLTFLTHGEPEALEAQRQRLADRGWQVHVPRHGEEVVLIP